MWEIFNKYKKYVVMWRTVSERGGKLKVLIFNKIQMTSERINKEWKSVDRFSIHIWINEYLFYFAQ